MISVCEKSMGDCHGICCRVITCPNRRYIFGVLRDDFKTVITWVWRVLGHPLNLDNRKKAIVVLRKVPRNLYDCFTILVLWKPISESMADKLMNRYPGASAVLFGDRIYYTCRLVTNDNKCLIHRFKPGICSEYPLYEKTVREVAVITHACGYWNQMMLAKCNWAGKVHEKEKKELEKATCPVPIAS